ncbi:type I restriction enzyme HsdR N-terminal domain-containing protein [bacterium]|nr:type I restriction enzyme HsdR N-terminal domain-containing protein [bacterium]
MAPLHPFMYAGCAFKAPLTIVDGRIRCAIKHTDRPATPEEYVRQEVLHFLALLQAKYLISIGVETPERFDSAVSVKHPYTGFNPYLPPILIIETKHVQHRLTAADEQQLRRYLAVSGCAWGFLTNRETSLLCQRNGPCTPCNDLAEIETLISTQSKALRKTLEQDYAAFERAHDQGCFVSFQHLAMRWDHIRTRFQFRLNDTSGQWTGNKFHFCEIERTCGFRPENAIRSRKTFAYREFERLWRIIC